MQLLLYLWLMSVVFQKLFLQIYAESFVSILAYSRFQRLFNLSPVKTFAVCLISICFKAIADRISTLQENMEKHITLDQAICS